MPPNEECHYYRSQAARNHVDCRSRTGLVYSITKEPIAQQARAEADIARFEAFPEAESFVAQTEAIPDAFSIIKQVHTALDADGNPIGITAAVVTKGYNAGLNLTVGIGADGVIRGVIVGAHSETPGLGAKAAEDAFQAQYTGKQTDTLCMWSNPRRRAPMIFRL